MARKVICRQSSPLNENVENNHSDKMNSIDFASKGNNNQGDDAANPMPSRSPRWRKWLRASTRFVVEIAREVIIGVAREALSECIFGDSED